jgi:hypothetical protein
MMMEDEFMVVEIIVESMVMMEAKNSLSQE